MTLTSIGYGPKANATHFPSRGVHATIDAAVDAAERSLSALGELSISQRKELLQSMREAAMAEVETLARRALVETGLGRYEDKLAKNRLAIEGTPGVEALEATVLRGDDGLCVEDLAPWGVIGVVTPCTNPTETIINNAISMVAAGNTMVICPHPAAREISLLVVELLNRAIERAGGPSCVINVLSQPSVDRARELMFDRRIRTLTVTGGPEVVKVAMQSGKNVIAAGPGNPPAVVDETATLREAAASLVFGASFDNNIVCVDEKQVIAVESIVDTLMEELAAQGAFILSESETEKLEKLVLAERHDGPTESRIQKCWVGKDASMLLDAIGIRVDRDVRLLVTRTAQNHPFVWTELLMPILAVTTAPDAAAAIELGVCTERGNGHTAVIHSNHVARITQMASLARTSIFVVNGAGVSGLGVGAEGHTSFTIASPTGHGLTSARTFARRLRMTGVGVLARN